MYTSTSMTVTEFATGPPSPPKKSFKKILRNHSLSETQMIALPMLKGPVYPIIFGVSIKSLPSPRVRVRLSCPLMHNFRKWINTIFAKTKVHPI